MARKEWIDIARGIAILSILTRHSGFGGVLYQVITAFDLPLFFFISGYLFHFEKYKLNPRLFATRKAMRLLLPYFATCIIAFVLLCILLRKLPENTGTIWIKTIMCDPVLDGAMWFLPALFLGELVFFLLAFIDSRSRISAVACCLLLAAFVFTSRHPLPWISLWSGDRVAVYLVFMYAGYLYSEFEYKLSFPIISAFSIGFFYYFHLIINSTQLIGD